MLQFVICDDDKEFIEKVKLEIGKVMMKIDEEYKTYLFTEANENLVKMIKSDTPKIYILDVQMPKINGIELASKIRQQDYKSIIIMLTSFNDYKNDCRNNCFNSCNLLYFANSFNCVDFMV